NGTLNQTGGRAIAADQFIVNASSVVNLSGGTISSGADLIINSGGTFNLNAGTNNSVVTVGINLGDAGNLNLNDSATLTAKGTLYNGGLITNNGTGVSTLVLGAGVTPGANTFTGTIADGSSGQIGLTLLGGAQTLSGDQNYTGPTLISGGN